MRAPGYGQLKSQNGDKPKRRQVKMATPKRRQNWHGQNGDKSKPRQKLFVVKYTDVTHDDDI